MNDTTFWDAARDLYLAQCRLIEVLIGFSYWCWKSAYRLSILIFRASIGNAVHWLTYPKQFEYMRNHLHIILHCSFKLSSRVWLSILFWGGEWSTPIASAVLGTISIECVHPRWNILKVFQIHHVFGTFCEELSMI